MANYATQQEMEDYFGEEEVLISSDRDGDGSADTDVIDTALANASREIDSYLGVRYDLPLSEDAEVLRDKCLDIAMYKMSIGAGSMTSNKKERYEDATSWLEKLSKGTVTLGIQEEEVDVQDETTISSTSEARKFSRTTMAGVL